MRLLIIEPPQGIMRMFQSTWNGVQPRFVFTKAISGRMYQQNL